MPTLGAFDVGKPLNRGGFGVVYRAVHRDGTPAAVKLLDNHDAVALQREVLAIARLDHPHIVRIFDHGRLQADSVLGPAGSPYFIMERCSGGSVGSYSRLIDWDWTSTLAAQLLDGLAHAHARGVIHLDIKPGNILFATRADARPGPKLVDFGISVAQDGPAAAAGTPRYMPPEQFDGDGELGPWTDLYALGVILWTLVSGRPFPDSTKGLVAKVYNELSPFQPRFDVPDGLESWLRTLLQGDWRGRFLTAAAARQELANLERAFFGFSPMVELAETPTELLADSPVTSERSVEPAPLASLPRHAPKAAPHSPAALRGTGRALLGIVEPPFIGRDVVCDALWTALLEAQNGGGRCVLTGPKGVGRRRCMRWLAHQVHAVAGGSAPSFEGLNPEHPARSLVCRALFVRTSDPEQVRARLVALGCWSPTVQADLDELFGHDDRNIGPALAVRILGAVARRIPVVLTLPNVTPNSPWLSASADLDAPLFWVFSSPGPLDDIPVIEVEPLGTDVLSTALTEWVPMHPQSVEPLVRHFAGLPGRMVDSVLQGVDSDVVTDSPRGWRLDPSFVPTDMPPVSDDEREIVACIAWLEPWCTFDRLSDALEERTMPLAGLLRRGVVRETGRRFHLADGQHRSAARDWLSTRTLERVATELVDIEEHHSASVAFERLGKHERALQETIIDLQKRDRTHLDTRVATVSRALDHAAVLPLRVDLHGALWMAEARCLWEQGEPDAPDRLSRRYSEAAQLGWHEVAGICAQYLRLSSQDGTAAPLELRAFHNMPPGDARNRRLGITYRDIALHTYEKQPRREALEESLTYLVDPSHEYDRLYIEAELELCRDDPDCAVSIAESAIEYAREHRPDRLVNALVHLCSMLLTLHRFAPAVEAAERAARRARLLRARPALMVALGNQALALAALGHWERSAQVSGQALHYCGYPVFATVLRTLIAVQAARTGDWEVVGDAIDELEEAGESLAIVGWDASFSVASLADAVDDQPALAKRMAPIEALFR